MWLHVNGADYARARCGVAASNRPDGPFWYAGSFRPDGQMARDLTASIPTTTTATTTGARGPTSSRRPRTTQPSTYPNSPMITRTRLATTPGYSSVGSRRRRPRSNDADGITSSGPAAPPGGRTPPGRPSRQRRSGDRGRSWAIPAVGRARIPPSDRSPRTSCRWRMTRDASGIDSSSLGIGGTSGICRIRDTCGCRSLLTRRAAIPS